jgi:hypothetical protein
MAPAYPCFRRRQTGYRRRVEEAGGEADAARSRDRPA